MEEEEFQGHVTINITCLEDTDKIILHAHQELEISEGDVNVVHLPTHFIVKKEKAVDTNPATPTSPATPATSVANTVITTTMTATTTTLGTTTAPVPTTIIPTTGAAKTTEVYVAPVPVGAARLVPVSSSFIPENACNSATACASNPGIILFSL